MDHMENEVVVDEKKSQMRTTTSSDSGVWNKKRAHKRDASLSFEHIDCYVK